MTFTQKRIGDVHIAWENKAHLEVHESGGGLQVVYPERSIRAEPFVALVDAVVDRKGTRGIAEEYLNFLFTDEAQTIISRHYYRPSNDSKRNRDELKDLELFGIDAIAPTGRPRTIASSAMAACLIGSIRSERHKTTESPRTQRKN